MGQPKIGLLPLYMELYDRVLPGVRPRIEEFEETIILELAARGAEVVSAPVCRVREEFERAVRSFECADVDVLVTLHLAYSPSLESAPVLCATNLPVIVLDTTPTYSYGPGQDSEELMYNHGIHGVQDLCSVLKRNGKQFWVEAGHWRESDVLDRVMAWAWAGFAAARMRSARIGLIGRPFCGMGDFAVSEQLLGETIGIEVVHCDLGSLRALVPKDADIEAEIALDRTLFSGEVDSHAHWVTTSVCLTVRGWIEREQLVGFTMNFEDISRGSGFPTVPFLEASKAMARGCGYAGEGDVLTAALVGAIASSWPEVTFAEMFCPDWEGDSIFLSHMGEFNVKLAGDRPALVCKEMPWLDADAPVMAVGKFRGGDAVLVNLAPGADGSYSFIVCPGSMLDVRGKDEMVDLVRGWFKPQMSVADFLEAYSTLGGTHHSALVYDTPPENLIRFGEIMGWEVAVVG